MVNVQSAGEALLQNPQFMEIFQRALGGEEHIKDIPPEGDPRREEWLRDIQKKIQEENMKSMKAKLEEVQSDENGQWMYVMPEPGFCVKCTTAGGGKVFVNVCQHERIAEPIPMDDAESTDEVKFKIPLSCGQARPESDKSGKPCKVYDVIVNPSTVQRSSGDHEFRCFVISLCIHWIKQKCEPTLKTEEYRNMNFKVKGALEPQRIRISSVPKAANALGDEIRLPQNTSAASPLTHVGGRSGKGNLVEEVSGPSPAAAPAAATDSEGATASLQEENDALKKPSLAKLQSEGAYDWTTHMKPMLNPYLRENVPAHYIVEVHIPTVTTVAEVEVRITPKLIELLYVDAEDDAPFLRVPLDYPIDEDAPNAKFVRKTQMLKMKLTVKLPDETTEPATKADRDVVEIEEEENRRAREERENELREYRQRMERKREEDEEVMKERRSYVENLAAVQEGAVPPSLKEEVDKLPPDQLSAMLQRLETKTRRGDSIDEMLEKFPESMIDAICRYIRSKLGLEQRPLSDGDKTKADGNSGATTTTTTTTTTAPPPVGTATTTTAPQSIDGAMEEDGRIEYNFAKKAEKLVGVAFHNRYLFALD
ncbi:PIH1 domain-containing protein 1 [Trypanosoma grayi]|uniref:PIH1 domain-containing protein 1 n=1 Tax=Trypanosoma grayi TaxID=71804 RepID=UPI0004F3F3D7|nr:PIH1 domain-containing protein 1 [Trypanosoma grayi]KEG13667.1 PIH1 domain-containing protein 1 [Trypanosoma grayi]